MVLDPGLNLNIEPLNEEAAFQLNNIITRMETKSESAKTTPAIHVSLTAKGL